MTDTPTTQHFFASSVANWFTTDEDRDLRKLIQIFEEDGLPYALWLVPVPHDAEYRIRNYIPQVEGAVYLGTFTPIKED